MFRKVRGVTYARTRIETPDNDFLDIDRSCIGSTRAAVILHGLEGDSGRSYVLGMVKALNRGGWDAIAVNFRGCSGEPNRQPRLYHSGETGDVGLVVDLLIREGGYEELALVGFSLGGNVILKYLGEQATAVHPEIKRAAVFSVPCDLASCASRLAEPGNRLYLLRFMKMLREKIAAKKRLLPDKIDASHLEHVKTFAQFDDRYTAPLHGFKDAQDYWERASSRPFLPSIAVPTLLAISADDPFLGPTCYPHDEAQASPWLCLEIPRHGGHVGFVSFNPEGEYWSEQRAVRFLNAPDPFAAH
jgi:predicted alpha/beta-fold hydrolase